MHNARASSLRHGLQRAFGAPVCMVLFAVACGSSAADTSGAGDSNLSDSGVGTDTHDAGAQLFTDAGNSDGAASTSCPTDSPNQQGCSCTPGTSRACYSGPPSTRNVKTCHDGTQACLSSGELVAAFGPCEGEKVPGPGECQPDCAPGEKQCDGQVPQTCDANGEWQSGSACPSVCSAGECTGACVPGTKQCSGTTPQTCDSNGAWQSDATCPYACQAGACVGSCVPNSKQCIGKTAQTCDAKGDWQDLACPYLCSAGECTGSCVPGTKQCSGTTPQTCDANGAWQSEATCPYACQAGACTGSCVPYSKQCSGATPQTCSVSGNWTNGATCSGNTNQCENGTCVCAKDPQGPSTGTAPACSLASLPSTLHVTISGVSNGGGCPVCGCFKGTFTLTKNGNLWSSGPISGCQGQSANAYIKFNGSLGITDQGSAPGSGNSELFPTYGGTCSPLSLTGGSATAGNNGAFCSDAISNMKWVITD